MSLQAPRTSMFTFQSAVHSAHVLQCLNEQRQRDVLCDVTVVVDGKIFRAHCSVLASCSDYFQTRVTNITRQNSIIILPDEVTVEGFEPLLQFAYTSTLLFHKDNIHAIHRSAEFLGFLNVEKACFDFLIPKFSKAGKPAREDRERSSCQDRTPSEGLGPIIEVSQPNSLESCSTVASGDLQITDLTSQCPQNTQGQTSREKEHFCLENCGPQMSPLSLSLTANSVCPILSMPCQNNNKPDNSSQVSERDILDIGSICDQSELSLVDCALSCELSSAGNVNPPALTETTEREVHRTVETIHTENKCDIGHSPLRSSEVQDSSKLLEQTTAGFEGRRSVDFSDATLPCISHVEGSGERSSVEREVAEHLAKGFWPDPCPSQTQSLPLDPIDQNNLAKAADFHWLKQLDLSSSTGDCPFLRDLGASEEHALATDSPSQSEKSPDMSSFLISGEDSDLDTDGDTEANIKKAEEVQLPFPVKQISVLSRSAFLQLLKHQQLNQKQLEFVHEVRRRSKNRIAAQRCRKRKLDSIHMLECEISTLRSEKERLIRERSQLEQNLEETRQSFSGLCKSVSLESSPEQDHLQLFAKFSSADCPITAFLVPMSSPSLLGKDQDCQPSLDKVSFPSEGKPENSIPNNLPQTNPHTEERGSQQICFVTASILNA